MQVLWEHDEWASLSESLNAVDGDELQRYNRKVEIEQLMPGSTALLDFLLRLVDLRNRCVEISTASKQIKLRQNRRVEVVIYLSLALRAFGGAGDELYCLLHI